jgi:hypothetical protein
MELNDDPRNISHFGNDAADNAEIRYTSAGAEDDPAPAVNSTRDSSHSENGMGHQCNVDNMDNDLGGQNIDVAENPNGGSGDDDNVQDEVREDRSRVKESYVYDYCVRLRQPA